MEKTKISLLRSYSRSTIYSCGSQQSLSGLEKLYPRTSTPYPDDSHVIQDEEWFAPYAIFRRVLENPLKKACVRGIEKVPAHFLTGHLVKVTPSDSVITISLDSSKEPRKWSMKKKFQSFKKIVKNFFKKCYKNFIHNKCDSSVCPVTCECQRVKSFLNKTIFIEDSTEDGIAKTAI